MFAKCPRFGALVATTRIRAPSKLPILPKMGNPERDSPRPIAAWWAARGRWPGTGWLGFFFAALFVSRSLGVDLDGMAIHHHRLHHRRAAQRLGDGPGDDDTKPAALVNNQRPACPLAGRVPPAAAGRRARLRVACASSNRAPGCAGSVQSRVGPPGPAASCGGCAGWLRPDAATAAGRCC